MGTTGCLTNYMLSCLQTYDSVTESGGEVVRVPIVETHVRSLNLAVSQGIGLYEAMRQLDGPH